MQFFKWVWNTLKTLWIISLLCPWLFAAAMGPLLGLGRMTSGFTRTVGHIGRTAQRGSNVILVNGRLYKMPTSYMRMLPTRPKTPTPQAQPSAVQAVIDQATRMIGGGKSTGSTSSNPGALTVPVPAPKSTGIWTDMPPTGAAGSVMSRLTTQTKVTPAHPRGGVMTIIETPSSFRQFGTPRAELNPNAPAFTPQSIQMAKSGVPLPRQGSRSGSSSSIGSAQSVGSGSTIVRRPSDPPPPPPKLGRPASRGSAKEGAAAVGDSGLGSAATFPRDPSSSSSSSYYPSSPNSPNRRIPPSLSHRDRSQSAPNLRPPSRSSSSSGGSGGNRPPGRGQVPPMVMRGTSTTSLGSRMVSRSESFRDRHPMLVKIFKKLGSGLQFTGAVVSMAAIYSAVNFGIQKALMPTPKELTPGMAALNGTLEDLPTLDVFRPFLERNGTHLSQEETAEAYGKLQHLIKDISLWFGGAAHQIRQTSNIRLLQSYVDAVAEGQNMTAPVMPSQLAGYLLWLSGDAPTPDLEDEIKMVEQKTGVRPVGNFVPPNFTLPPEPTEAGKLESRVAWTSCYGNSG